MVIGPHSVSPPLVFAPLAGITNLPLRLLAKEAGCGLVCSEMVSANGLVHRSAKTLEMLASDPAERPLSIQIFGARPDIMAEAAVMVAAAGADILDINFGCAVRKVVKTGSGVALMRTPDLARDILERVRRAIDIPLTIKIRSGWDASGDQAVAIARMAQDCGVDAVAVHPRTAGQGFGGRADWSLIRRIKAQLDIPVIGNGDVVSPEDALDMISETGCDAVMIGRAAIGNPWIFSHIVDTLAGRSWTPPTLDMRRQAMERFLRDTVALLGEARTCRIMRSRLSWFVKGLDGGSRFRASVTGVATLTEAFGLIAEFFDAAENPR
ncbi:MAG: tRNA dihydrouridine synthase DusB [Pseudomonadota bacterium]